MRYDIKRAELNRLQTNIAGIDHRIADANEIQDEKVAEYENEATMIPQMRDAFIAAKNECTDAQIPIQTTKVKIKKIKEKIRIVKSQKNAKQKMCASIQNKINKEKRERIKIIAKMKDVGDEHQISNIRERIQSQQEILNEMRTRMPELRSKMNPSIEMKEREIDRNSKIHDIQNMRSNIKRSQTELRRIKDGNRSKSENFCPKAARMRSVTVANIRLFINSHHRKFEHQPIGPLGDYIEVQNMQFVSVVQQCLQSYLSQWLVSSSADQQTLRHLIQTRFGFVLKIIQFPFKSVKYQIPDDPFANYKHQTSNSNRMEYRLHRISDQFIIKDNNAWIYNTLLVVAQFENCYAFDNAAAARELFLNVNQSKYIKNIYTTNGDMRIVNKRGQTVNATPVKHGPPLLSSDQTQMKIHYQMKIEQSKQELNDMNILINDHNHRINDDQRIIHKCRQEVNNVQKNISTIDDQINSWNRELSELEGKRTGDNELHDEMTAVEDTIVDEMQSQKALQMEMKYNDEEIKSLDNETEVEMKEYSTLKEQLSMKVKKREECKQNCKQFVHELKEKKNFINNINPNKIRALEKEKSNIEAQDMQPLNEECKELRVNAGQLGDRPAHAPFRDEENRNRGRMNARDVHRAKIRVQGAIQIWNNSDHNMDKEKIKELYFRIKPTFEKWDVKMRACNQNVDDLCLQLRQRHVQFMKMKDDIRTQLGVEFRYVMLKQGYEGKVEIDYGQKRLEIFVKTPASRNKAESWVSTKSLSGGERSFTQVALIMALQKFADSPFCVYDEFDVFMDDVNRGNSIKILIEAASKMEVARQYFFITPHDVSPIVAANAKRDIMKIVKLAGPRS